MTMRKSIYLLIGACILIVSVMAPIEARAIDRIAPDSNEYGSAGSYIRLALSNTSSTGGVTQIKVPIYIKAPAPTDDIPVTVRANVQLYSFRPISRYISSYANTYNRHAVWFNDETVNGNTDGLGQCSRDGNDVTLNAGNFRWVPEYGLWRTTVYTILRDRACDNTAGRANNAQIDFRMRITSFTYTRDGFAAQTVPGNGGRLSGGSIASGGNAWISYAVPDQSNVGANSYYFSTNARDRGSGYANYHLAMATPCSITSGTDGVIELYDLDDNHTDNGPSGTNDNVQVTVTRTDVNPNQNVTLTTANSGGGPYGNGDEERYLRRMRFEPGGKYVLNVSGIYYWNVLQYRLPFENIAYITGCPAGQLSPRLTTSLGSVSSVREGATFTANFGINSSSRTNANARTFARVWYESDGNGVFNAGDNSVWTRDRNNPWDTTTTQGDNWVHSEPNILVDAARGTRICVSWNIVSSPTTGITIANPNMLTQCFTITRPPSYVHIWGNDLRVGSGFGSGNRSARATGLVTPDGASWVEYAITAPGAVTNLASQSGAMAGSGDPQASWSYLTFANQPSFGSFTAQPSNLGSIPNVRGAVRTARDNGAAINTDVTGNFTTSSIPNLNDFTDSRSITATGTITIDQNIQYRNGPYANAGQIPQLVLIGNNINIMPNVTRIDAWLVASGTINTCSTSDSRASVCGSQLRINGPVMADQLNLRRTYRNLSQLNDAAETINLRGDAYLWANRVAQSTGTWQTVHTTELPPRY